MCQINHMCYIRHQTVLIKYRSLPLSHVLNAKWNECSQPFIYIYTRGPLTALPVWIKYEEKLQNFTTKFTTFLLTLKFRKSTANAISFCSENPYLSIYVNETFSPWGRHKSKKGKHVNLLICMVIKTMPQVLLCVAAFWLKMISKWRGIFR